MICVFALRSAGIRTFEIFSMVLPHTRTLVGSVSVGFLPSNTRMFWKRVTDGVVSGLDGCCAQTATERTSRTTDNATGATRIFMGGSWGGSSLGAVACALTTARQVRFQRKASYHGQLARNKSRLYCVG